MNDKAKTAETTRPVLRPFQVNYQWVNNKYQLRNGTLVIPAENAETAKAKAIAELEGQALNLWTIKKVAEFNRG